LLHARIVAHPAVLVWFYVLALILLAGAVVNELRFEGRQA